MTMTLAKQIELFLQSPEFAVIGASSSRGKYGNKVLRCYLQNGKTVYAVNPREKVIEGLKVIQSLNLLPDTVNSISVVTPPIVTEQIVTDAIKKGIKNIWLQPGAESDRSIKKCIVHGINIISGGPCILVSLGFKN